ncbi:MAG: hypothetical protein HWD62_18970 [Cyclobacteriaceae bacterium]|nr:MAG: hypothetical protein HWD62_18970 [Cyclobacteriaceae bacterium]
MIKYKISDLPNHKNIQPETFRTNVGSSIITRVIPIDEDGRFFVGELMPAIPRRFTLINSTNFGQISSFGDFPIWSNLQVKPDDFSYAIKVYGNLFQSKLEFNRSDSTIIAVHPYIPVIELIKLNSISIPRQQEIIGPTTEYPQILQ